MREDEHRNLTEKEETYGNRDHHRLDGEDVQSVDWLPDRDKGGIGMKLITERLEQLTTVFAFYEQSLTREQCQEAIRLMRETEGALQQHTPPTSGEGMR